ncbi:MAG: SLOG family protein [Eubacteriales bacterium]|jgi:uncharacterized phage-like protein YoqJ
MDERAVTCCFTGHRPEKLPFAPGRNETTYRFFMSMEEAVQRAILRGYTHFITGMAEGFDLWAADMVVRFRRAYPELTLEAAIPYPGQARSWTYDSRDYYGEILKVCDKTTYVSSSYTKDCMYKRNRYMVDHASLVITAFTGGAGGTAYTLDYAQKNGVEVINIFEFFEKYTPQGLVKQENEAYDKEDNLYGGEPQ